MNKKGKLKVIFFTGVFLLMILAGLLYRAYYNGQPQRAIEKSILSEESESRDYLSSSFLNQIESDSGVNKDFYNQNVNDYDLFREIVSIEMKSKNVAFIIVKNKVVNKKTGFTITTTEKYNVSLVKEGGSWKVGSYNLLESTTN
ncbi:MAG: hypothetical protein PHT36_01525 [Patescibacteria group bacterium]|nr:hypothetical protein [Patescibacteria group bacterium]